MSHSSTSQSLLSLEGLQNLSKVNVAIVATEWNDAIINELINGAKRVLEQFEVTISQWIVPGAVEIPFACQQLIQSKIAPDVIIAFGAVIKGETPHFDYVCMSVTQGITQLNTTTNTPVVFGVLTVNTEQQAWDRLGGTHGHKGEEAAIAAMKMVNLKNILKS